ncbi:peptidoglycan-binding protein [uncultured Boseongicola sp.]|uniref:peptidoglycan-binding protein n=1 Tax=uncultured Boseongicola sp. TaxID=1648499 RepID=UPI00261C32F1|nr:peptidoglycan-binding protein [uncultured Boseongicola sp.]
MRHLFFATAITLASTAPVWADGAALMIGNEDYAGLNDLRRGDEVTGPASAFERQGFEVFSVRDAEGRDLVEALSAFEAAASDSDRLLVVLAGRFAHSATDTYFLPTDARPGALTDVAATAIPLSQILAILAETPGQAILALANSDVDGNFGPLLQIGIGDLDLPQGITLLTGAPRPLAQSVQRLARPGENLANLRNSRSVQIGGFVMDGQVFVADLREPAVAAQAPTPTTTDRSADLLAWRLADRIDTIEAYEGYIDSFPGGQFTAMATGRIEAMTDTPEARAERTEQALELNRDQRREIQRDLTLLNFNTRGIDGIFGRGTRAAISSWQTANSTDVTGFLSTDQITRLDAQAERRAAELEAEAERRREDRLAQDLAFWEETGARDDEPGLRAYLTRFPDGDFAEVARTRLETIERRKRAETNTRDRQLWDEARIQDTEQSYRDYLAIAPQGAFRQEAEDRIAELTRASQQTGRQRQAIQEENALNLTPNTRRAIESRLDRLGLKPGKVDGTFDDDTRRAIRRYQSARNLDETGYLNEAFVVQILADSVRSIFR